jgi:hypothetical protein
VGPGERLFALVCPRRPGGAAGGRSRDVAIHPVDVATLAWRPGGTGARFSLTRAAGAPTSKEESALSNRALRGARVSTRIDRNATILSFPVERMAGM